MLVPALASWVKDTIAQFGGSSGLARPNLVQREKQKKKARFTRDRRVYASGGRRSRIQDNEPDLKRPFSRKSRCIQDPPSFHLKRSDGHFARIVAFFRSRSYSSSFSSSYSCPKPRGITRVHASFHSLAMLKQLEKKKNKGMCLVQYDRNEPTLPIVSTGLFR